MQLTDAFREGERLMSICNACRYCEGHCPVFPAMERRLSFAQADIAFLANLCHNCGACFHHCQYAPPHEFEVNVPKVFAEARSRTYERYAWPGPLARLFANNGVATALMAALGFMVAMVLAAIYAAPRGIAAVYPDAAGGFYNVVPHQAMVTLFGAVGLFVVLALAMGVRNFWRDMGERGRDIVEPGSLWRALLAAFTLRHLGGGSGDGCTYPTEAPSHARRRFHHLTFYGFLLCFAATSTGTVFHYGLGWPAPYDYVSLPKLFGIAGGLGLLVGPAGLLWLKAKADRTPMATSQVRLDITFIVMLFLTSLTGLALMLARETVLMGPLLIAHLGIVLGLFLSLPYGKFVHGFYRLAALIRDNLEIERGRSGGT